MTEDFLQTCREEVGEVATEIAVLEDGQITAESDYERVMRIRRLRRVLSRLDVLVAELEAPA
jgi:ABC-type molybdate transport system ATPase subunit